MFAKAIAKNAGTHGHQRMPRSASPNARPSTLRYSSASSSAVKASLRRVLAAFFMARGAYGAQGYHIAGEKGTSRRF